MNPIFNLQMAYPDPVLSPNSPKRHWRYKQPAKHTAKTEAFYKAVEHRSIFDGVKDLQLTLTFYPPTKARRDLDNAHASMKAALDGVCNGLDIDDSQIRRVTLEWGDVVKGGAVDLELKGYKG